MTESESFLESRTVNAKPRNILGKLGLLIILEDKDNKKLDLGIGSLYEIKTNVIRVIEYTN